MGGGTVGGIHQQFALGEEEEEKKSPNRKRALRLFFGCAFFAGDGLVGKK